MKREKLKEIVADIIEADVGEIELDTNLRTLPGFDSVNILALVIALDERARIRLSPEQTATIASLRDIEMIASEQGVVVED